VEMSEWWSAIKPLQLLIFSMFPQPKKLGQAADEIF